MRLGASVVFVGILGACAGSREVSKLRYTSTDCPDPKGCDAPLGEQAYQLPDEAHDPVADAATMGEEPSCKSVAVAMTALELGNYASEEDDRASIIATHEKACVAAKLDPREMACMSTVTETKHVGYCTKKMGAPTLRVPLLTKLECRQLMVELRPNMEGYGYGAQLPIYEKSCVEDGWSQDLATCMQQRVYNPLEQCRTEAPGWLFAQIQARIDKLASATK